MIILRHQRLLQTGTDWPSSGFFITYMGSALGTSPGRLVETDAKGNIIHEWPEDVEGTVRSAEYAI